MILEAMLAAVAIALTSLVGVFFFSDTKKLLGMQKYAVPIAVGVFLSLVLYELIPETLELSPEFGGIAVAFGFIFFYVLENYLHKKYHRLEADECDRKGAATLLLIGDGIHNIADGVILGGAFLVDPTIGVVTAIGLALHEIPQEIVEFGVLIRAGFSKTKAAMYNLISASSIILGTVLIIIVAEHAEEYIWIITGVAAGNLLFLAASDLLPRIHGNLKDYGSIWHSTVSITLGFLIMTSVLIWTHENFGHGHEHDEHHEELLNDEHEASLAS
ncbi:MAG: ZIP family metal transporter [Candidatus Pacebacteria bacterium]|nr:ZIP family metal transporter [Candidatus Paceibacterota bacterium]